MPVTKGDTDRECQKVRVKKNIGLRNITENSWGIFNFEIYQFRLRQNDIEDTAVSIGVNNPPTICQPASPPVRQGMNSLSNSKSPLKRTNELNFFFSPL